jgi:cation:H+ antiporter
VAKALGVDERIIGLTVVAFGTSVPELAASIVAAVRGHSDLAIGNVIGSNIFNLLLVLGTAGAVAPFATDLRAIWLDLSFLIGLTTAAGLMLWWSRTLTRVEGGLLLTCYGGFLALLAAELR